MTEACESVRLDDEKAPTADIGNSAQFTRLADFVCAKRPAPGGPQILLILAANKALEIYAPLYFVRLHEIQRGKGNRYGCRPAESGNARFRSPNTVPAGITVGAVIVRLL